MRILVLGGTVFLSRTVAQAAQAAGHDVTCLARGRTGTAPEGTRLLHGDRQESSAYDDLRGEWDAVVDVTSDPHHARAAAGALTDSVGHWTYVSSCSVYANQGMPGEDESAPLLEAYDGDGPPPQEQYGQAKVACEQAYRSAFPQRSLIVRPGLICGPADGSDRFGYWPARLSLGGQVVVPEIPQAMTQTIDVLDLAQWIVHSAERGVVGTFNAVGPSIAFDELLRRTTEIVGFSGELVRCSPTWLSERGAAYWAGPDSLPHWLPAGFEGFAARAGGAARSRGLVLRPVEETIRRVLEDELERGVNRERRSGLSAATERELLRLWSSGGKSN